MIYAVHRVKSIIKLKIYNFTKETRVCAHQSVNVRSSLTLLTMNGETFFNNLILKIFKNCLNLKNLQKKFQLLSQSLWAIVSVEERLRLIYRRYFWLTKNVFKILKLTEKILKKNYSNLNTHLWCIAKSRSNWATGVFIILM